MTATASRLTVAPGSVVVVRDEEWLVTSMENTLDGQLLHVQGLSDLVRGTTASFYESLDVDLEVLDPRLATVCADSSPGYRRARLWLEATLRKTAVPLVDDRLTVADGMLADSLPYQQSAVRKALDPDNLRPRILLADAVGLGKTLEIGMILSELVRRGRGERILIVTPATRPRADAVRDVDALRAAVRPARLGRHPAGPARSCPPPATRSPISSG